MGVYVNFSKLVVVGILNYNFVMYYTNIMVRQFKRNSHDENNLIRTLNLNNRSPNSFKYFHLHVGLIIEAYTLPETQKSENCIKIH